MLKRTGNLKKVFLIIGLLAIIAIAVKILPAQTAVAVETEIRSGGNAWTKNKTGPQFVPNEIVVRFRNEVSPQAIEAINRSQNSTIVRVGERSKLYRLRLPTEVNLETALTSYRARPEVSQAARSAIAQTFTAPNDPYYYLQWHLDNPTWGGIQWQNVWERPDQPKGTGVPVAIIDTGAAWDNPNATDLAGQNFLILPGSDVFNKDSNPTDDNGHGTHVAGTIAQATNNGRGVAGIASGATIIPIKVLDNTGSATEVEVIEGIYLAIGATAPCNFDPAVAPPAKVINMSIGWPVGTLLTDLPGLPEALDCALTRDTVTVAAAGNDGSETQVAYPAAYPTVIAVGATTIDKKYTWYSNAGVDIDLVAPGGEDCSGDNWIICFMYGINPDKNNDGYADAVLQQTFTLGSDPNNAANWAYYFLQGTSMASPHVVGVAALVRGVNPNLSALETRSILEQTADNLGNIGWPYGHGLVNALAAVNAAAPASSPTPTPTTTPPTNQAPTAINDTYSTRKNTTLTVNAPGVLGNDSDPEGNQLTTILVSNPSRGTINLQTDGSFTYKPNLGFVGTDKFTYKANDGSLNSNTATVTINVKRK